MANNDKQIVLGLDIPKTAAQINKDIKKLQGQLAKVRATGALDTGATVKEINAQIAALQSQLLADRQAGLQECMKEISKGINSGGQNEINDTVKETEGSLRGLAKLAASFKDQMAQVAKNITKLFSVDSVVSRLIAQTQKAVSELKEIDTLLTNISITNDRISKSDLSKLG
ncbi:MAG: hypothetical protein K2J60_19400, partial [Acetatifactor sp.]|nr:hypothetical protein [Acetatifactor sp.]